MCPQLRNEGVIRDAAQGPLAGVVVVDFSVVVAGPMAASLLAQLGAEVPPLGENNCLVTNNCSSLSERSQHTAGVSHSHPHVEVIKVDNMKVKDSARGLGNTPAPGMASIFMQVGVRPFTVALRKRLS